MGYCVYLNCKTLSDSFPNCVVQGEGGELTQCYQREVHECEEVAVHLLAPNRHVQQRHFH